MDLKGIGNEASSLLASQIKSNAALQKAAESPDQAPGSVGNALQGFGGLLQQQMNQINNLQAQADFAKQTYAVGGDIELHNVILAGERAEMALQLAMQVRNKILAAYQEISHMNI